MSTPIFLQLSTSCSDCTSLQNGRSQSGEPSKSAGADPGHQPGGLPWGRVPAAPSLVPCLRLGEKLQLPAGLGARYWPEEELVLGLLLGNQSGNNRGTCFLFSISVHPPTSSTDPQPQKATLQSRGDTSSCAHLSGSAPRPLQLPAPGQPPPRRLWFYPSHPYWADCSI